MATDDTRPERWTRGQQLPAIFGRFDLQWGKETSGFSSRPNTVFSVRSDNTFRVHSLPSSRQYNVRFSTSLSVCYYAMAFWFSPALLHLSGFLRKTAQSTICPNSWCELNSKTSELCFGSFLLGYVAQPSSSSFQSVWLLSHRWMQQV